MSINTAAAVVSADHLYAAVVAAGGAALTALATALQQRAARQVTIGTGLRLRQLTALAGSPLWLSSFASTAAGYSCYLSALGHAPLILVQPIMCSGLVLGPLFAAMLARRRLDPTLGIGGILCVAGLSILIGLADPRSGSYTPVPNGAGFEIIVGVVVVLLTAVLLGSRRPVSGFALLAGGLFGLTAAMTKVVLAEFALGWSTALTSWPVFAAVVCAVFGFLSSQRAFQLSPLLAPVNTLISVADTVVALLIGVSVFAERLTTTPAALLGQGLALVTTAAGIYAVVRRTDELAPALDEPDRGGRDRDAARTWG